MGVYNGGFDPTNIATNYIGDTGSSGVNVSAGVFLTHLQTVTLVMASVSSPAPNCNEAQEGYGRESRRRE